ncbi:hypothetical protein B0H13DRAFT_1869242 [Mycena leptocephala]|nr:hypothetical protein B0H13DRAFT_1869242 [Mycena leptocephala]
MLLILLLVVQLSKDSRAMTLAPRSPYASCDDINSCRRLFDILWGCLSTIFACTWVSVHPNVPPPNQTWLSLLGRRLRLMLVAVIAPELMVGFAARQFFAARWFSREFGISKTHGYFISMGGFVSLDGCHPIASRTQLGDGGEYIAAIRGVQEKDIVDKSKRDALSKGIALAQGIWFTAQCAARVAQRLPVTELEVATLAFAVVNIFIWILWWGKPLDVQRPIPIGPVIKQRGTEVGTNNQRLGLGNRFSGLLFGNYSDVSDVIACISAPANSVPAFWSIEESKDTAPIFRIALLLDGAEMWMWRASSLLVAAIPALLGWLFMLRLFLVAMNEKHKKSDMLCKALLAMYAANFLVAIPIYVIARLFLIILPFTTIRALPPGAFVGVNWSVYIPHL